MNIGEDIKAGFIKSVYNFSNPSSESISIGENINARVVAASHEITVPAPPEFNILPFILIPAFIFLCILLYFLKKKKIQGYRYKPPS
jgi:hypothetical protein